MRPAALAALLVLGCADPGDACPAADLSTLATAPSYAVVSSDYGATAIALLDEGGGMLEEAWLGSGTRAASIVATLSGDVSLPGAPFDDCTLVLLDRFGTDVVTFLDVCGGQPLARQVDVGGGFAANPQDAVRIDERRAWVSRLTVNLAAGPAAMDRGNDVVVVDVEAGRVVDRIDLSALDDGDAFARPTRLARLRAGDLDRLLVGTARLSSGFDAVATGAVALVDPGSGAVETRSLAPMTNCGELDPVPGEPSRAVVTCGGATFGQESDRRDGAGVALLELTAGGELTELGRWQAADHPELGVASTYAVPLGDGRVVAIASGDSGATADRAVLLDLMAGSAEVLFEAAEAFVLGEGAYDPEGDLLLIPDASAGAVRRFVGLVEIEPVDTAGCRGLPPREVARIR